MRKRAARWGVFGVREVRGLLDREPLRAMRRKGLLDRELLGP